MGRPDHLFRKEKFVYDSEEDAYICPAGKELTFRFTITTRIERKRRKIYRTTSCATSPFRTRCTSNKRGRTIERWEH